MRSIIRLIAGVSAATLLSSALFAAPGTAQGAAGVGAQAARPANRPSALAIDAVVTPAWLEARLSDPDVIVLHISHDDYAAGHVPGARHLDYSALVTQRENLSSELPGAETARAAFEALGVSDRSTVVVYAHEAPMATRALFTLAWLGVERIAYLDGGFARWWAEGRPVSVLEPLVTAGRITTAPRDDLLATAEWIRPRLAGHGVSLVDTRTDDEFSGAGSRSGTLSHGHLADAKRLGWEELFEDGAVQLKPRAELERLFRERVTAGDIVVTYCRVGYRASATWFVARALGYDARLYDGSYQDWSQLGLPTVR